MAGLKWPPARIIYIGGVQLGTKAPDIGQVLDHVQRQRVKKPKVEGGVKRVGRYRRAGVAACA